MMRRPGLDRVTGISVLIVVLVAFVVVRVLTAQDFTADQRTMVIQGALSALAMLTGFWLNGTPDPKDQKHPPAPTAPPTQEPAEEPKP